MIHSFPYHAKTRSGATAHFAKISTTPAKNSKGAEFTLLGFIELGEPELWTASGRWAEDGGEHHNDLIFT